MINWFSFTLTKADHNLKVTQIFILIFYIWYCMIYCLDLFSHSLHTWLLYIWKIYRWFKSCAKLSIYTSDLSSNISLSSDKSILTYTEESMNNEINQFFPVLFVPCIHAYISQEYITGLILGLRPANERWRYFVTTSLIGWVQPGLESTLYYFHPPHATYLEKADKSPISQIPQCTYPISDNAHVVYPRVHHSEQKCAYFCFEWCIVGYGTCAWWDLWMILPHIFHIENRTSSRPSYHCIYL